MTSVLFVVVAASIAAHFGMLNVERKQFELHSSFRFQFEATRGWKLNGILYQVNE
jgi:hypothetical protein